jgi:tRNA G18 (ribose-2'-O)-methylase SpoU
MLAAAALCGAAAGAAATAALLLSAAARSSDIADESQPLLSAPVTADEQLAPQAYEQASTGGDADRDSRLLRRVETVLRRRTQRVVVVLERLCDGHNYAAVLRTCEAAGVQHVWLVAPPSGDARYESAKMQKRRETVDLAQRAAQADANRSANDDAPQPESRRQRRRNKRTQAAAEVWDDDVALDREHAAFGKNAARFLSVREFLTSESCMDALRADGRTVWATDLGQGAEVLAPGAAWLGDTRRSLPDKLALVIGTESTGVSRYMLEKADRRVYLPQNGFADSLNASVAAALCLHTLLWLYGRRAVGDLATSCHDDELDAIRRSWCGHLARDEAQAARMMLSAGGASSAADAAGERLPFDDLRRPDEYREHNGRGTLSDRRRDHKRREAERLQSQAETSG